DDAHHISKNDRNRLLMLAIKDAYVAPHYVKIVGLLSGDAVKKLSEELGKYGEPDVLLEVLEDTEYRQHHNVIVSAAIANKKIGIAQLYVAAINTVSNEVKEALNTALGRDVNVSNEDLISILGDAQFATHRTAILKHVEVRMDATNLHAFLEDARSILSAEEVTRLEQAMERKKKHAHEDAHEETSSPGGLGLFMLIFGLLLLFTISSTP
ncbi:MAG: hypothetical protein WAZ27_03690, partial [Minisyncoccia bacterium]